MVFEKPRNEGAAKVTPYIEGQRAAIRGRSFNPYSKATQRQWHNDFDAGYKDKLGELHPSHQEVKTIRPQLAVFILGLILAGIFYYWNYM